MARLEEIAELLTEELHDFGLAIKRLEALRKELDSCELKPDTTVIDSMLRDYHELQKKIVNPQIEAIRKLAIKLENSRTVPRWQVVTFWVWSFLNLVAWAVTIFKLK